MFRIKPLGGDSSSPSTKTDPLSPPGTEALGAMEDLTRETSASSNAPAGRAFEDDCEEPTSPAKPGAPKAPAKAELGERIKHEISPPPTEISLPTPGQEKSWQPRYRWSYRGSWQSARERDLTSCLSLSPRADSGYSLCHGLRGGEDQPVVQVPEKTNPAKVSPSRDRFKHPGEDLRGSRQSKA